MKQVLLIDDDNLLATNLQMNLLSKGFDISICDSLEQAATQLQVSTYELILLDVNLPDGCGIQFCKNFRNQNKNTPIIMVTAKVDEESAVEGITSGANDYIRKPLGLNELAARMTRLLDRESSLSFGPIRMDVNKRLAFVNSQPLSLAKKEFQILQLLVQKQGDIVTRDQIIQFLGDNKEIFDRTIDSHLSHLRKKLREGDFTQIQITPVYGIGYRLETR